MQVKEFYMSMIRAVANLLLPDGCHQAEQKKNYPPDQLNWLGNVKEGKPSLPPTLPPGDNCAGTARG